MVLVKEDILSLVHEKVDKENRGMTGKDMEDIGMDIEEEPGNTVVNGGGVFFWWSGVPFCGQSNDARHEEYNKKVVNFDLISYTDG